LKESDLKKKKMSIRIEGHYYKLHYKVVITGRLAPACNPSYLGLEGSQSSEGLRLEGSSFEVSLGKWFRRPYPEDNQRKTDWRSGSSGRAPAL
jgi:hypothetical protein